ncbi:MAG: hypothetical protein JO061_17855 [Acidobacteriaceae bacterium]|nr:hypothetical protein [Acidobacteriaceae bacterium]
MDFRIDRNPAIAVTIGACIGVAISFWPVAFVASIAVPACALLQRKRLYAAAVAFAYYAGAIWLVMPSVETFFGPKPGKLDAVAIWLCGAALLTVPYALLWTLNHRTIALRSILAVLVSVPPPLGIIGVANPITAAGFLFPGTAWFGLAATLAAIATLCVRPASATIIITVVAIGCNLIYPGDPKPPADWEAVNTDFGGVGRNASAELNAARFIQQRVLASKARVIVFPETVVPRWTEATDLFWQQALDALASSGKTILLGTTFDIPGQVGYENGIVIRGAQTGTFLQHIPVPVGMWNPFRSSSVPLNFSGPSCITIDHRRAAILICYEQVLTWPMLAAAVNQPEILVAIANDSWAQARVAAIQRGVLASWARLFSVRTAFATLLRERFN